MPAARCAVPRRAEQTRLTQDRVLSELLAAHAGTAFARDHALAAVRTYEEFRRAVPVRAYEALRPYMDRVLAGEATALLPPGRRVLMFSRTSGTTGQPKHIPVTQRFLAEMRRGWNIFGPRPSRTTRPPGCGGSWPSARRTRN